MATKKKILAKQDISLNPVEKAPVNDDAVVATPSSSQSPISEVNLSNDKPSEPEEDDMPLLAAKPKKVDGRVKKPQTEAQKAATAKMKAALAAKWEKTRAEKAAAAEAHKKEVEERVVKKALAIKKKQIKQQLALEEISDDDEPIEQIVPKMKKAIIRQSEPPRQKIIFV